MVLLNATVSEPGATLTTADIKDFFLMSDLSRPEYQLSQIPDRIQRAYNIADFAINERVLVEITKGIYGLPQAALLAKQQLDAWNPHNIPSNLGALPWGGGVPDESDKNKSLVTPL